MFTLKKFTGVINYQCSCKLEILFMKQIFFFLKLKVRLEIMFNFWSHKYWILHIP